MTEATILGKLERAEAEVTALMYAVQAAMDQAKKRGETDLVVQLLKQYSELVTLKFELSDAQNKFLLKPNNVRNLAGKISGAAVRARSAIQTMASVTEILDRIGEVLRFVGRLKGLAL